MKKIVIGIGALTALMLTACGTTTKTVDGKVQLPVPGTTAICNLLEIDTDDAGGAEVAETYKCVHIDVYDKNEVGEEYKP